MGYSAYQPPQRAQLRARIQDALTRAFPEGTQSSSTSPSAPLPIRGSLGFIPNWSLDTFDNVSDTSSSWTTTLRQSDTRSPQLEYSNPNSGVYNIGSGTIFTTSTESLETVVNASGVFVPTQAVGEFPQSIDSEINLQVEQPAADGLPSSGPLVGLPPQSRYSNPNLSNPSISGSSPFSFISTGSLETWDNI
jgi:hypothetical protein